MSPLTHRFQIYSIIILSFIEIFNILSCRFKSRLLQIYFYWERVERNYKLVTRLSQGDMDLQTRSYFEFISSDFLTFDTILGVRLYDRQSSST